ncbi:hypothetical protein ADUPG1_012425, partial [Aduncisulcus paluster]
EPKDTPGFDESGVGIDRREELIPIDEINTEAIKDAIRYIGIYPTEAELSGIISEMTGDDSNSVNFVQFRRVVLGIIVLDKIPRDSEEDLMTAFKALDPEGNGYITSESFKLILTANDERLDQPEVAEMLDLFVGADGRIDIERMVHELAELPY